MSAAGTHARAWHFISHVALDAVVRGQLLRTLRCRYPLTTLSVVIFRREREVFSAALALKVKGEDVIPRSIYLNRGEGPLSGLGIGPWHLANSAIRQIRPRDH